MVIMARAFDYSKWDNIELSDDESDLHPNIDKESWFRMKHRTRLEREEKEDKEVAEYKKKNQEDEARLRLINARLKGLNNQAGDAGDDAEFEDVEALQVEKEELQAAVASRLKRIAEIEERRKWNIDNICKVSVEKTVVNSKNAKPLSAAETPVDPVVLKAYDDGAEQEESGSSSSSSSSSAAAASAAAVDNSAESVFARATAAAAAKSTQSSVQPNKTTAAAAVPKGAEPAASITRERMAVISYNDYCMKHEQILETYSEIQDIEATKEYLFKNCDVLLHEHAQSYMLLSCLEDEMNGKHKRMRLVCRQSQILSHIHDLGTSMKRDPRDVILPFFKRIEEKAHYTGFLSAVDDFTKRIQKRAVEKRKEMDAERRAEQRAAGEGATVGPGGLDPYEVFESLPAPMREAFESQDTAKLQEVLARMDPQEAKSCMKRCVDSGLWVPSDASIFDTEEVREDELEEIPPEELSS